MANLLSVLDRRKGMFMFVVLSLLPDALLRPSSQFLETVLELLVLLFLFLRDSAFPLLVEFLWRAPFLPGKLFDLTTKKEHHIGERRFVRVGFKQMR